MSIHRLAFGWSIAFGSLAVGVSVALVWTGVHANQYADQIVRATESLQVSNELKLQLLSYSRISNLLASTEQPGFASLRSNLEADTRRLLSQGQKLQLGDRR